eukprot:CAMPEP_0168323476 /NCGR_PEP_ID=MMETSP0213-20121227/3506_1 /TAXON_ID=151035 /ORGANISM="Euplotes harpa, Strain FSP1.4" /LENGTH=135 /DNA_ID=CAMNT_0008325559 /DNA_START=25 /DNA_END=432 /DNA_ORIENTATION=-
MKYACVSRKCQSLEDSFEEADNLLALPQIGQVSKADSRPQCLIKPSLADRRANKLTVISCKKQQDIKAASMDELLHMKISATSTKTAASETCIEYIFAKERKAKSTKEERIQEFLMNAGVFQINLSEVLQASRKR